MEDEKALLGSLMEEENMEEKYMVPPLADVPWLITAHHNQRSNNNKLEKQTFRTNTGSYIKTIPELHRNTIVGAHQDWLILRNSRHYTVYSLWNPVTSQFLRLPELIQTPELPDHIMPLVCLLTESLDLETDNPDHTCMLLLFFNEGFVHSCRPTAVISGDGRWVMQSLELDGLDDVFIYVACGLEGAIYGYACGFLRNPVDHREKGHILVRVNVTHDNDNDNDDSSSSSSSCPIIALETTGLYFPDVDVIFNGYPFYNKGLVESCGVLYFVLMTLNGRDDLRSSLEINKVFIWRLDLSEMEWIRVKSLRNRAFLMGEQNWTWCWAGAGGFIEENCVYLAKDDKMYSYNLQDDTYTTLLYLRVSCNINDYLPIWFVPSNHQRYVPPLPGGHTLENNNQKINHAFQEQAEDTRDNELLSLPGTTSILSELPADISQSIAKRMNLFDYMNLRVTCKSLHKANPRPQWRTNGQYPMFMFLNDSGSRTYGLLDPLQNVSRSFITFNKSPDIVINFENCKDGWLLLSSGNSLEYLNLFEGEAAAGKYPSFETLFRYTNFVFSTCPTSSDCLTVTITGFGYPNLFISCYNNNNAGDGEWEHHPIPMDPDIFFYPRRGTSPKYHNNAFYLLANDGRIGEFKFIDGKISWKVHTYPFDRETRFNSCYLVELDGELISVFIGEDGLWVGVFKFDVSDNYWTKLDTLGDHVVFVSSASSFSIKAENGETRNRIYLPCRKGNEIVFYSLDTCKYHTYSGGDPMDDLYGLKVQSFCCWV